MEKKYNLTIDPTSQKTKPAKNNNQISIISKNLNLVTGMTINEISMILGPPHSYTWTGGVFNNGISNDTWQYQSVFGLDFDNTQKCITPDKVLERFEEMNLVPQIWYETFSSTEENIKFRVMLFLDKDIDDPNSHKFIVDGLKSLFPEADKSCFNRARFFFGGKNTHFITNEPISTLNLINHIGISILSVYNRTRELIDSFQGCSFLCNLINAEKGDLLYNNYYRKNHFYAKNNTSKEEEALVKIDFGIAFERIKILEEFNNGTWLTHPELFGLATNLQYIKGGLKYMKSIMIQYNGNAKTKYTKNNFNILPYVKLTNYPAQPVYLFSRYEEDAGLYDIIGEVNNLRGKIKVIEHPVKIKLEEAELKFQKEFENVMSTGEIGKIYILKMPTALGKTRKLLSIENCTIAFPTHALKNEVCEKMTISEFKVSPDKLVFEKEYLNRKLKQYYSSGLVKECTKFLVHISNYSSNPNDRIVAVNYLSSIEELKVYQNTILTTHAKCLSSTFMNDTLIFDEDPLNDIININSFSIHTLEKIAGFAEKERNELLSIIEFLKNATPMDVYKTSDFVNIDEEIINEIILKNNIFDENIIDFFHSQFFMKDSQNPDRIHYVNQKHLPKNKKIIILSATISPFIYKKLYGDRVEIFDVGNVEQKGNIIQYTNKSCSRNSLKNYSHTMRDFLGDKEVITFKGYKNLFNNSDKNMHFGNSSGYNSLSGIDISVVGTPHFSNVVYFLFGKNIGINFDSTNNKMTYQKIIHNGFEFMFNTFSNLELRKLQLELIEAEMVQACGRARTLREKCTVELYSNYPLKISDKFIF